MSLFNFKNRIPQINHLKRNSIIVVLILAAIPVTIFLTHQEQDIRNFAAPKESARSLSNDLIREGKIKANKDKKGNTNIQASSNISDSISKAKKRKDIMLKLAKENPSEFLLNALPSKATKDFTPLVKDQVEKEVQVQGKFVEVHMDDFKNKKNSRTEYRLHQFDKNNKLTKSYTLHFAKNAPSIPTDSSVSVQGFQIDNELVAQGGGTPSGGVSVINESRTSTVGNQRTLVFLVNFQDDPTELIDGGQVKNSLFNNQNSVNNFYKENSYNKIDFSVDVAGYFTIPYKNFDCNSKYDEWAYSAEAIAFSKGIDISKYNRHVFVFAGRDCDFSGLGSVGGNPSKAWITGTSDESVFAHELGHNLGLSHANSLDCDGESVKESIWDCHSEEYGDPTDVMGGYYYSFNAPHKDEVGWLDSSQITTVNNNSTVTLTPLEQNTPGLKAVKIPIPNSDEYYYLSFRQRFGFDSTLDSRFVNGANIHIWKKMNQVYDNYTEQPNLIDTFPNSYPSEFNDVLDSALIDGKTFTDPYNGISVKQISHSLSGVSLEIKIDKSICRHGIPDFSIDPISEVGSAGQELTYTITLKNNDTSTCAPATFNLYSNPDVAHGDEWHIDFSSNYITLNPGQSTTITQKVSSSYREPLGDYLIENNLSGDFARHLVSIKSNYIVDGVIGYVNVSPGEIITALDKPVAMSTLAYDTNYQPIKSGVTYEWSMSSTNSIGSLDQTSGVINKITPQKLGFGEITIKATFNGNSIIKTVPVHVLGSVSPTPTPILTTNPTSTPTQSPTNTPTPTFPPNSTILRFNSIKLHGIGLGGDNTNPNLSGNLNPLRVNRAVSVELVDGSAVSKSTSNGSITFKTNTGDFGGDILINNIASSASYLVKIKSPGYLKKQLLGIINVNKGVINQMPPVTLVVGDINEDNTISITDFNLLIDCYSDLLPAKNCNATKKLAADISDDGKVNANDYSLFLRELSTVSGE